MFTIAMQLTRISNALHYISWVGYVRQPCGRNNENDALHCGDYVGRACLQQLTVGCPCAYR
jgi:hypothetical protein